MSGDNPGIRIGRDLNGQLIIGDRNAVTVGTRSTDPDVTPALDQPALDQDNTAENHGTVYAAAHGDIHVNHHGATTEPELKPEPEPAE